MEKRTVINTLTASGVATTARTRGSAYGTDGDHGRARPAEAARSPVEVTYARAERDLLRLPEKIGTACVAFIFGPLVERPYRLGGELSGQLAGLRSAHRGSYRIVHRVEDDLRRVDIDHEG